MANTRHEKQEQKNAADTSAKNASKERERVDIERSTGTQHGVEPTSRGSSRGDVTRRGGSDLARDPFAMMNAFRREMDRLFEDFGLGGSLFRTPRMFDEIGRGSGQLERSLWSPQVEVGEREGKLHVSADLPGLSKDDVRVELLDNNLTIEGERRHERKDERGQWSERSYGRFFRSIPLPEGINPDSAHASFENGVLDISFDAPKQREQRGRKIEIGGESSRSGMTKK